MHTVKQLYFQYRHSSAREQDKGERKWWLVAFLSVPLCQTALKHIKHAINLLHPQAKEYAQCPGIRCLSQLVPSYQLLHLVSPHPCRYGIYTWEELWDHHPMHLPILQVKDHTRNISSSLPVIIFFCYLPDPLHRVLQLCKASSNKEQLLSDMPKQHKRWQRIHRMPEIQLPTCITSHQWSNMTVWWSQTFKKEKENNTKKIKNHRSEKFKRETAKIIILHGFSWDDNLYAVMRWQI